MAFSSSCDCSIPKRNSGEIFGFIMTAKTERAGDYKVVRSRVVQAPAVKVISLQGKAKPIGKTSLVMKHVKWPKKLAPLANSFCRGVSPLDQTLTSFYFFLFLPFFSISD